MKQVMSVGLIGSLFACTEATSPAHRLQNPSLRMAVGAAASEAVLPSGYAGIMGSIAQNFPHASFRPMRYQQVFLGSDVVHPVIVGLCLRQDDEVAAFAREKTLTIKLGPTTLDHTNLTTSFDGNYSALPTEVFTGTVTVPAAPAGGTPADFDFCIPFTQQYDHPAGSNVIVEVVNTSTDLNSSPRDACNSSEEACTTALAWAVSPTATTAAFSAREGLIMKFVSPAPPAPVDPVSEDECKKGGWSNFQFRNQGQCIRFIETGFDSRASTES